MVTEQFFLLSAIVIPIVQGNVIIESVVNSHVTMAAMLIIDSPMTKINEEEKHVFQEPIANYEEEQQQSPI
jgi:hypothetical protein